MTDHIAESNRVIEGVHDWMSEVGQTDETMAAAATDALRLATLATADYTKSVAEQLFVANLLEYAKQRPPAGRTAAGTRLWDQIELGLGLTGPPLPHARPEAAEVVARLRAEFDRLIQPHRPPLGTPADRRLEVGVARFNDALTKHESEHIL